MYTAPTSGREDPLKNSGAPIKTSSNLQQSYFTDHATQHACTHARTHAHTHTHTHTHTQCTWNPSLAPNHKFTNKYQVYTHQNSRQHCEVTHPSPLKSTPSTLYPKYAPIFIKPMNIQTIQTLKPDHLAAVKHVSRQLTWLPVRVNIPPPS